uniref:Insulin receptor substrate n=1 Tax=Strongyloides stercoralis TaxID=6248 RepID=A0A0K0EIJ1_STRER|nr:insulin receptor substrate [Strongyloides stercoralis]
MNHYFQSKFQFRKKKSLLDVNISNENSPKSPISLKNDKSLEAERTTIADFAIFPSKERKNKYKQQFIVLLNSDVYVYRNSKDFQKKKQPNVIINLKNIFNISFYKDSEIIKSQITIMSDINTYFIKISTTSLLYEWYEILLEKIRVFRSIALHRDVQLNEFFDIAFDCTISVRPKMKKNYENQECSTLDDLYDKIISNNYVTPHVRFCMYYNAVVICNIGIQATCDGYPPFNIKDYIKFPTNVIRDFGKQEKYLFLRIGRCSEVGCGELWFKLESTEKAKEAHIKIMELFDSVTEKRKSDARKYSSQNLAVRMSTYRERSFTNPIVAGSNISLNIEEKNERAKTWDDSVEESKRKISYSNTINNPIASSNSRKSSRNLSPIMPNIENSNIDINYKRLENDEKCIKKNSICGVISKFVDSFNDKLEKNSNNMSHRGSLTSISSTVENTRKLSTYNNGNTDGDFCYAEDVRKLSMSAVDSKVLTQKSNCFGRLHISPKRQQSFTSTNLSPLIKNSSNALLTTDYVVMDSIDILNTPLTNSLSNITSQKDSLKLDEIKSHYSDKSDDGFLRSRTNTNVSKNTLLSSEGSRTNTFVSNKSTISNTSRSSRANSFVSTLNNDSNNLAVSSQFINDEYLGDNFSRIRSCSLGNQTMLKQNVGDEKFIFTKGLEKNKCRAISLNIGTNKSSGLTITNNIKSDDNIKMKNFNNQLKLLSLDDILNSNKSFFENKEASLLLMNDEEDITEGNVEKLKNDNQTNFLFEKTFEISTKLPNTTTDSSNDSIFEMSENFISCKNDDKNESLDDYTYNTVVVQKNDNYIKNIPFKSKSSNHSQVKQMPKKIVSTKKVNNLEKQSSFKISGNSQSVELNDLKTNGLNPILQKNDYTFHDTLNDINKNKGCSNNTSNNFETQDNIINDTTIMNNDTTSTESNHQDYCEFNY